MLDLHHISALYQVQTARRIVLLANKKVSREAWNRGDITRAQFGHVFGFLKWQFPVYHSIIWEPGVPYLKTSLDEVWVSFVWNSEDWSIDRSCLILFVLGAPGHPLMNVGVGSKRINPGSNDSTFEPLSKPCEKLGPSQQNFKHDDVSDPSEPSSCVSRRRPTLKALMLCLPYKGLTIRLPRTYLTKGSGYFWVDCSENWW